MGNVIFSSSKVFVCGAFIEVELHGLVKTRSHEIGTLNCRLALKFDRHIGSTAAEVPVKFQSDRTILNTNLAASRLYEILRKDVFSDFETGPSFSSWCLARPQVQLAYKRIDLMRLLYDLSLILCVILSCLNHTTFNSERTNLDKVFQLSTSLSSPKSDPTF